MKAHIASLFLLLAGCDPSAPCVVGSVFLGDGVDPTGYETLELRFEPTEPDPDHPNPPFHYSTPVEDVAFPYEYRAGCGVGTSQVAEWLVTAWLSADPDPGDEPGAGEPSGARSVDFGDCRNGCAMQVGADLTLEL